MIKKFFILILFILLVNSVGADYQINSSNFIEYNMDNLTSNYGDGSLNVGLFADNFNDDVFNNDGWNAEYFGIASYIQENGYLEVNNVNNAHSSYWLYSNNRAGTQIKPNFTLSDNFSIKWESSISNTNISNMFQSGFMVANGVDYNIFCLASSDWISNTIDNVGETIDNSYGSTQTDIPLNKSFEIIKNSSGYFGYYDGILINSSTVSTQIDKLLFVNTRYADIYPFAEHSRIDNFIVKEINDDDTIINSGNLTVWHNSSNESIYGLDIIASNPENTSYTVMYKDNSSSNFTVINQTFAGNNTIDLNNTYNNLDVRVILNSSNSDYLSFTSITYLITEPEKTIDDIYNKVVVIENYLNDNVYVDESLYLTQENILYKISDSEIIYKIILNNDVVSGVLINKNNIFFTTSDNFLYTVNKSTGVIIGKLKFGKNNINIFNLNNNNNNLVKVQI